MAKKFIDIQAELDKFGDAIPTDPIKGFTEGEKYIYKWSTETIKLWREELLRKNKDSSGNLASSFDPLPIENKIGGFSLKIEGAYYWKYIDLGVKGARSSSNAPNSPFKFSSKYPPLEAITKWLNFRPDVRLKLAAIYGLDDSIGSRKLIAKNMQKSIFKRGIKATPFVQAAINRKRIDELQENLAELFNKQINELIIKEKK